MPMRSAISAQVSWCAYLSCLLLMLLSISETMGIKQAWAYVNKLQTHHPDTPIIFYGDDAATMQAQASRASSLPFCRFLLILLLILLMSMFIVHIIDATNYYYASIVSIAAQFSSFGPFRCFSSTSAPAFADESAAFDAYKRAAWSLVLDHVKSLTGDITVFFDEPSTGLLAAAKRGTHLDRMREKEIGRQAATTALATAYRAAAKIKELKEHLRSNPQESRSELQQQSRELRAAHKVFVRNFFFYFSFPLRFKDVDPSTVGSVSAHFAHFFGSNLDYLALREAPSHLPRPTDLASSFDPILASYIDANSDLVHSSAKVKIILSKDEADTSICLYAAAHVYLGKITSDQIGTWTTDGDFLLLRRSDIFRFILSPIPKRHQKLGKIRLTDKKALEALFEWPESLSQGHQVAWLAGNDYSEHGKGVKHLGLVNMQARMACLEEVCRLLSLILIYADR